jgi:4-amino-4-deoxy-L-arabinose transferase-like glycosyltransferase
MTDSRSSSYLLAALVALAALVRLAALLWLDPVVTAEGSEYLRLAQNLRAGAGYQGMFGQLNAEFPPLYPLLIALVSHLAGGAEAAARSISLVLGTATVLPVYGIAARLGGERAGLIAAGLTAVHGTLVALSISTYVESTYFFLLACGMYYALEATARWSARTAALSGALFGLAYLARPEAIVYVAVAAAFSAVVLWRRPAARAQRLRAVASMVIAASLIMAPYVVWLSENSGYLRFEGKSGLNGLLSERMRQGLTYHEAAQSLGPNQEPVGVFLPLDQFAVRPSIGGVGMALHTMTSHLPSRTIAMVRDAVSAREMLGGTPLVLLAALGLVAALRGASSRSAALLFALFCAAYLPVLLSIEFLWTRFLFPVALLMLPWAASGAAVVAEWLSARTPGRSAWAAAAVALVVVGITGATTARGATIVAEFTQMTDYELREAGRWLASQPPDDKLIAAMGAVPVYYARGRVIYLPWSSEEQVLAYLRKLGPQFVILKTEEAKRAPYLAGWLEHGIPGACASPLRTFVGPEDELRVYRWSCAATDPLWLNQWCQITDGKPVCRPTRRYQPATHFSRP